MSEEEIKKDIIYQIEMESYDKFNNTIATMNDHLGEIFSYSDVENMKQAQLEFEKELAYKYLKERTQALLDIKEYIKENKEKFIPCYGDSCDYDIEVYLDNDDIDKLLDIVNKALGGNDE